MSEDYQNLCIYHHPKMKCSGTSKELRNKCKFFPKTNSECPDFNKHGCNDCDCISAQFEFWMLNEKPE